MSTGDSGRFALAMTAAGISGLLVGSFLNVVIYRSPRGLSVQSPRSFCPACREQLAWWENIPVASRVALRGRCRHCGQPISIRYPLVEITSAGAFLLVTWAWHGSLVSAGYCALASGAIAVTLIEYDGLRAPLGVASIATACGLVIVSIAASLHRQWTVVVGAWVGTLIASVVLAIARHRDPECVDPRGRGRTLLLVAGCWAGGLGLFATLLGCAVWIASFLACAIGAWATVRKRSATDALSHRMDVATHPILLAPLATSLCLAMAASLFTAV